MLTRNPGFGLPLHTLCLLHEGKNVLSFCAKSIKEWLRQNGVNCLTVEPEAMVIIWAFRDEAVGCIL